MKILSIQGFEVAGAAWRWENLMRRGGHEVTRYQKAFGKLGFPGGRPTDDGEIYELAKTVDVVHVHTAAMTTHYFKWFRGLGISAPVCGTMHGVESLRAASRGVLELGIPCVYVTPNLASTFAHGVFIPNSIDPETEGLLPPIPWQGKPCAIEGRPTITSSRSYVARLKNHAERDRLVRAASANPKFPNDFLPNKTWFNDYVRKADFVWDHLQGYWGQQTVEGFWAGTIPIVAPDENARRMAEEFFGEMPPFGPSTLEQWVSYVKTFQANPEFRAGQIRERYDFVSRLWTQEALLPRWEEFYSTKVLL